MNQIKWYECKFSKEDIAQGAPVKFKEEMERAFHAAGWPEDAIVLGEARVGQDNIKLWITSSAAEAAEANGFQWRKYFVRDLPEPPFKKESSLLIGHKSAWNLLREGGKDPFIK